MRVGSVPGRAFGFSTNERKRARKSSLPSRTEFVDDRNRRREGARRPELVYRRRAEG